LNADKKLYEFCLRGKQNRLHFVSKNPKRSKATLEIVHFDVCGPLEVTTIGGFTEALKLYIFVYLRDKLGLLSL